MSETRHEFIECADVSLKYTRWSGGENILVCFHGFGQNHLAFQPLYESWKLTHTVFSFDLPFHGETVRTSNQDIFYREDWIELMKVFIAREQLNSFEIMGYSMGAKYAMISALGYPDIVSHLHLLAPDGISTHFSYRFSAYPMLFSRLFKSQIKRPSILTAIVRISRALKLMDNYTLKFAETQMDTEQKRAQVYYSWVGLRHFLPDLEKLSAAINSGEFKLTTYLGEHDKIINQNQIAPLVNLLHSKDIIILKSGHSRLIEALSKAHSQDSATL